MRRINAWVGTLLGAVIAVVGAAAVLPADRAAAAGGIEGIDVASHQGGVDWGAVAGAGIRFAYVKATEGTGYQNPYFAPQYFADHGGAWSADNQTLPGSLDIEWHPYGATCYGLSPEQMVGWIAEFVNRYRERTEGADSLDA